MSKENIFWSAVLGLVIGACAAAVMWLTGIRQNVSSDGSGIDGARAELTDARGTLEEQASILGRAVETTANIERAAEAIADTEREDAELIESCRSILAGIRRRGEAQGSRQE